MKYIKEFTTVFLTAALLTGCRLIYDESSDGESTSSSESSSSGTSSSSAESTISDISIPVSSSSLTIIDIEPAPPEIKPVVYPEMKIKFSPETEEIMELFGDFGAFYGGYLSSEYAWERVTSGDGAESIKDENDISFNKVINGSITTYDALIEKLRDMLTDKCIENTSAKILDWFRTDDSGGLYVRRRGAGGYLGSDYLRIDSINYPDDETIALDMSVVGEKENWGYESDWIESFKIALKRTGSGLRIDEIDGNRCLDFAYLNSVVYNNVYMVMDNVPELTKKVQDENGWQRPLNDTEQILKLLEDYSDFYLAMTPSEDIEKYADKSRKISVERVNSLNEPYTAEYYKSVGLPVNTLDELNEKLDEFVTEKPKSDFLKLTDDDFLMIADNGDLYISGNPYGRATIFDADRLYLDSIEYPDDNSILVTVTTFRNKEDWGIDKNIRTTYTVNMIRIDDGLRINECDLDVMNYFGYFDEIIFGDIT